MSRLTRGSKQVTTGTIIVTHPADGVSAGMVYEGEAVSIKGLIAGFASLRYQTNYTESDGFGRLEVTGSSAVIGVPEALQYEWSLDAADGQRDLREHPKSIALGAPTLQIINDKLDAGTAADRDAITLNSGNETELYNRLVMGSDYYFAISPVLRKSISASDPSALAIAVAGTGEIWQLPDIISSEPTMLASIVLAARDYDLNHDDTPAGYTWGWLKKGPKFNQRWGQKLEIVQDWYADNWDTTYRYQIYAP